MAETPRDFGEGYVAGNQNYAELFPNQHHAALGRSTQFSQQLRMSGVVMARVLKNTLADGGGGHSIDDAGESKLGCYDDVPVGRMATGSGRAARARFSRRQRRKRANDSGIMAL